jgi:hypothetical protein
MFQNAKPRFSQSPPAPNSEDMISNHSFSDKHTSIDFASFSQRDTAIVLSHLRREMIDLTKVQSHLMACPSRTSTAEAMEFAARRTNIEHTLLSVGQWFAHTNEPGKDDRLREACSIAGSIYVNYVLRGFQYKLTIALKTLKRRLMTCVERFELEDNGKTDSVSISTAVLFWALSVGVTVSLDLEERTWFVLRMSKAAKRLGLKNWEQALSLVNQVLWAEKLENETWKGIKADFQKYMVIG